MGRKRRVDLTELFDKVDLGVKSIGNWSDFEKTFYEQALQRYFPSMSTSTK